VGLTGTSSNPYALQQCSKPPSLTNLLIGPMSMDLVTVALEINEG
jgi:hypothetical protein